MTKGVFITGTDTGIGKTLVSALLARAWDADYWKPLQTGVAQEPGDTETVAMLARRRPDQLHPPACILQAPLSPWAAAMLENVTPDTSSLRLPVTRAPLVVEGAGGLYVPINETLMMIDLPALLNLPVLLVARSGLGTINHTLLSLHALRQRQTPVLGVIMCGARSASNRQAIERFGQTTVLAEIDALPHIDAAIVDDLATQMPSFASCMQQPA